MNSKTIYQRVASPTLPLVDEPAADSLIVQVEDDALAPVILSGDTVVINPDESEPFAGEIYAVEIDGRRRLWLLQDSVGGVGKRIGGHDVAMFASLCGTYRWYGPVALDQAKIIGRATALCGVRPYASDQDDVDGFDAERQALERHLESLLSRRALCQPRNLLPADAHKREPEALRQMFEALDGDESTAEAFRLDRQIDALQVRLDRLEHLIATTVPSSLKGRRAKLALVWSTAYEPFPAVPSDLAGDVLKSSIEGLDKILDPESDRVPVRGSVAASR
ncbi:MAG: S24 family peptidase [Geminicoccaceae bacterium]